MIGGMCPFKGLKLESFGQDCLCVAIPGNVYKSHLSIPGNLSLEKLTKMFNLKNIYKVTLILQKLQYII